jgi:hypothetical protein
MQSDEERQAVPGDGDEDAYQVGYGRPPKHTQFQAGQSGNPIGRRKGVRNFTTDVVRTLKVPVKVKESGRTRKISTQEGALMQLRQKALQGDARSLDSLITLAARFNNDAGAPAQTLGADDRAILDYFAAEIAAQFKPPASDEPRDDHAANLDLGELSKLDPEVSQE